MSLRRTPLFDVHVALGARMVPFAGFEMPVQYVGVGPEHAATRGRVGLFDVSHMGEVFVRGPHALAAVQHLITNDASRLVDGGALYTVMCNPDGGIVDDLVVYRFAEDEFLICVNAANREKDFAWMVENNPYGAELVDEGDAWAQLALQGRFAADILRGLTAVPVDALTNYTAGRGSVSGVSGCIVARTGYTGEDGFEVFCPADAAVELWNKLMEVGSASGIAPVGLGARDTLRLEARMPLYGHELTDETSPWQAGLARVVKTDKPAGFVGLEALLRRKGNERRRLVGLVLEGKRIARDGMAILANGEAVGVVTSGTFAPSLDRGIAMGYVDRELGEAGTRLIVDVRGKEAPAVVVGGAFYKRDY